ncbi:MAG: asparaginase [Burkholderiaceae bacterium]
MSLPRLLLIATGGTIASEASDATHTGRYDAATLGAEALLRALPSLEGLADITVEQPFALGSEHLGSRHWMLLCERVRQAQQDHGLRGIVITHGTDTLEESALVLDLLCERRLPVVITGAMRPASALSADGPMNLQAAVNTALSEGAQGAGVMVLMNDQILAPDRAWKTHSTRVDAFSARDSSPLADLQDAHPRWHGSAAERARSRPSLVDALPVLPAMLPRVDLVAAHVDMDPTLIQWLMTQGARGLVLAGTGHGTLAAPVQAAICEATRSGCRVVRATRVPHGPVWPNAGLDDAHLGSLAAGHCTPHKARTVLSLALAAGLQAESIQALLLRL